ncbi:hypothetical protein P0O24_01945 [Methanotrichaceae archaeon M04Ac]|uniref:Uncharacterized protein n=1 Tax=Candidatus Methanocrinis alkalitolerans TaxID=3033395 RepID=A0ABT5XCA2_9EURY|nr:hypothetical protein [Candidatus Methanocrinis alkalitolerans]MCR3882830.1 hypothetical protein [Methanothrix sp.]MDF0592344.1 hypothetical protein [Candidatus Methanocrinis alkalitolerans]
MNRDGPLLVISRTDLDLVAGSGSVDRLPYGRKPLDSALVDDQRLC